MQKIIINADDFGLSKNFNQGIIELIEEEIVTSTTVMINRNHLEVDKLKKVAIDNNVSVGLHLELTENSSIKEIERQLNQFLKVFENNPSHLDGHQHCHLTKKNLPKVVSVAKKHSLPIRSRFEEDRKIIKSNNIKTPDQYVSWHPKRREQLFEKLSEVNENVVELVCHPGYEDIKYRKKYNSQRFQELKILKSKKTRNLLSNFELISYNYLTEQRNEL